MIKDKTIYIKNIYYMLSYAFKVLEQKNYEKILAEKFDNIENLMCAILDCGLTQLLKQGLYKEYITKNNDLQRIKGKIIVDRTIKNKIKNLNLINCTYDDLSNNNLFNRIIKTSIKILIDSKQVNKKIKKSILKKFIFLNNIDLIDDVTLIKWNSLKFHSNNKIYELLLNICFFVIKGLIQTNENGNKKIVSFAEKHMEGLFERFVLEYYRRHYKHQITSKSLKIEWNIVDKTDPLIKFLPNMKTDTTLSNSKKTLIIDTKYYSNIYGSYFGKSSFHSNNLYQIYTYVKNKDLKHDGSVSGILLYAKTDEANIKCGNLLIDGNIIGVRALDLSKDFCLIKEQLDNLYKEFFC